MGFIKSRRGLNLAVYIGKDDKNNNCIIDLAKHKNILIAGRAGTGKSDLLRYMIYQMQPTIYHEAGGKEYPTGISCENMLIIGSNSLLLKYKDKDYSILTIEEYSEVIIYLKTLLLMAKQGKVKRFVIMFEAFQLYVTNKEIREVLSKLATCKNADINIIAEMYTGLYIPDIINYNIFKLFDTRICFKMASKEHSNLVLGCSGAEDLDFSDDILTRFGSNLPVHVKPEELDWLLNR